MTNTLNKLSAAFFEGIAHYVYGCICYNQMGLSPRESETFVQWLSAQPPAAESGDDSAENHTNHINRPLNRARRTGAA